MCEHCDYKHTTLMQIKLHKEGKHSGVNISCDQCEFTSVNIYSLQEHTKRKHEGLWFQCTVEQGYRNRVQCDYKTQMEKIFKNITQPIMNAISVISPQSPKGALL